MEPCTFVICSHQKESNEKAIDYLYRRLIDASFKLDENNPNLIIVLGGDGSFLHAIHDYDFIGNFLLINTGHLGFFSDYELKDLEECVNDIINKEDTYEKLPLFNAYYLNKNHLFLSDFTLLSEKTTELNLFIDNQYLTKSRCSGIVIASPIGSTGFINSLNSPVIFRSDMGIYQYSLLAPVFNRLYPNSINRGILSQNQNLFINVNDGRNSCILDGIKYDVNFDGEITISSSERNLSLIHFKDSDNLLRISKAINLKEE